MALGRTYSVALVGLNGYIVEVEADIGQTLPAFVILGLPDASLNEAKERIRSAAQNSGIPLSRRKITANLIPASLPKSGSGFDLSNDKLRRTMRTESTFFTPALPRSYSGHARDGHLPPTG